MRRQEVQLSVCETIAGNVDVLTSGTWIPNVDKSNMYTYMSASLRPHLLYVTVVILLCTTFWWNMFAQTSGLKLGVVGI